MTQSEKPYKKYEAPEFINSGASTFLERATRIGLATEAWEAPILPLNYARIYRTAFPSESYFTIFLQIFQAIYAFIANLFLFIVIKLAYYFAYRADVRERVGIFTHYRLEFTYLSRTDYAYEQLFVMMLEHSDGGRYRYAVT